MMKRQPTEWRKIFINHNLIKARNQNGLRKSLNSIIIIIKIDLTNEQRTQNLFSKEHKQMGKNAEHQNH